MHVGLTTAVAAAAAPQEGKGKQRMLRFVDRLSCALFGLANTVTIMFYTVENATKVGAALRCARLDTIDL